jgi:hypothetical protein
MQNLPEEMEDSDLMKDLRELIEQAHREVKREDLKPYPGPPLRSYLGDDLEQSLIQEMDYSDELNKRLDARERLVSRLIGYLILSLIVVLALAAKLYLERN